MQSSIKGLVLCSFEFFISFEVDDCTVKIRKKEPLSNKNLQPEV